ncbi:MAG: IPTL-CTERM sorting domain-containing protein [Phycisphaerae bacterium]
MRADREQGGRTMIIAVSGVLVWTSAAASVFAEGATRSLEDYTEPAVTFTVSIVIDPPPDTMAVGLEDSPPAGWTQIDNITDGGVYDAETHKVKWGPFFTPFPGQVSYDLLPPEEVTDDDCFVGTISFDGFDEPIQGDDCLHGPIPTVSTWGLAVMTLLTLSAGTIVLMRRRVAAT